MSSQRYKVELAVCWLPVGQSCGDTGQWTTEMVTCEVATAGGDQGPTAGEVWEAGVAAWEMTHGPLLEQPLAFGLGLFGWAPVEDEDELDAEDPAEDDLYDADDSFWVTACNNPGDQWGPYYTIEEANAGIKRLHAAGFRGFGIHVGKEDR